MRVNNIFGTYYATQKTHNGGVIARGKNNSEAINKAIEYLSLNSHASIKPQRASKNQACT